MSDQSVSDVRGYSKSTGYAKFLLVIIASHINPKADYAHPSLDTLARETTLSKPTVLKLILVLVALGELAVERGLGRGHCNRYRITIAHEAHDERSDEADPDQAKGKAHEMPQAPEDPTEGSEEADDDQPKGKAHLYLLPPLPEREKVNDPPEKVKSDPEKGQASVSSKAVLRTVKENTKREAFARAPEKVNDRSPWMMEPKAEAASPFWCPDCGYAIPSCVHRTAYRGQPRQEVTRPAPVWGVRLAVPPASP
jgi:Helix-turn-helix domain